MRAVCPVCSKEYETVLNRYHLELVVQDEHPDATPIEREQLITGICSNECWDKLLGDEDGK